MIALHLSYRIKSVLGRACAHPTSLRLGLHRTFAASQPRPDLNKTAGKVDILPLERPVEPGPEDCCQSGCVECVWEVYRKDLIEYNRRLAELQGKPPPPPVVDPFEELERKIAQQKEHQQSLEQSLTEGGR